MATLTSTKIKNTYDALLKASDNDAIGSSAKQITDGLGNGTPLYISTTQIGIGVTPEATYDLHVYSNAKVGGNLTVTGDLTVEGTTTTIDTQTLTVEDPLIEVASNNTSTDAVDIGWYGKYAPSGTVLYAGLFRDTGDSKFKLFRNLQEQPTTTVNTSGTGYTKADLVIGGLEATTGDFTDTVTVDGDIEVENSSGFGRIEIGGSSGGYIDLKSPFSDDFDLRLYTAGTNAQINAINGELDITAYTNINLQYQGTDVLVMSSTGVAVTGTGSFTGQVTIPETPVANTDAASKGYVDSQVTAQDLDFAGGSGTGSVDLDSQTFTIAGTTNEIETSASGQTLTIGLPNDVTIGNDLTVTTDLDVGGLITVGTNNTILQNDKLIFKSTTGAAIGHNTAGTAIQFFTTNTTALDTLALTISGANATVSGNLSVSGTGTFTGQVTIPATPSVSTDAASKGYVDSQVGANNELSEVLANGNTTGGTDIAVSSGDDITFVDDSKAIFGTDGDLEIYHYSITDTSQITINGKLDIRANTLQLKNYSGETYLRAASNGAVRLYYDGSEKLITTTTGISVTDTVSATTFSGQLDGTISSTTTATTQTQGDNSTKVATTAYVDSAIGGQDTLAEILANGNTTGGTDISVSSGDDITFTDTSKAYFGTDNDLQIYHDGSFSDIWNYTGDLRIRNNSNDSNIDIAASNAAGTGSQIYIRANGSTGAAELYHYATQKLATTSTGVSVTGGASFTDNIDINGNNKHIRWVDTYGNWLIEVGDGANNFKIHSESLGADYLTIDGSGNTTFKGNVTLSQPTNGSDAILNLTSKSGAGNSRTSSIEYDADNEYMYFKNAGTTVATMTSGGNVGIGTDTPDSKLDVTGGDITVNTTGTGFMNFKYSGSQMGTIGTDGIDLKITANADLQILPTGNVGIGLTNPQFGLSMAQGTGDGSRIGWNDVAGAKRASIICSSSTDALQFHTGTSDTERMRIADTLITVPTVTEIRGDIGSNKFAIGNMGDASSQMMVSSRGFLTFNVSNTGSALDATERMRIDTSGNVSIGTDTPLYLYSEQDVAQVAVNRVSSNGTIIDTSRSAAYINLYASNGGSSITFHTANANNINPTQRMRIDSSGNVGISTTSPTNGKLEVQQTATTAALWVQTGGTTDSYTIADFRTGTNASALAIKGNGNVEIGTGRVDIGTRSYVGSATSTTRLYLEGNTNGHNLGQFQMADLSGGFMFYLSGSSPTSRQSHQFYNNRIDSSPTLVGSIQINSSSTAFNTSSDYRLKENVVEMTGALDRVEQLKPSRFNFIGHEEIVDGFLAHEVQEIVPEAITGTKDEMRTEEYEETPAVYEEVIHEAQEAIEWTDKPTLDNTKVEIQTWLDDNSIEWQSADTKQELLDRIPEYQQEAQEEWTEQVLVSEAVMATREVPVYQGIDQSKLVPLLVGAIQELKAEIETLKQQINN